MTEERKNEFVAEMEELAIAKALIKPDPKAAAKCKTPGCWGQRGWYGVDFPTDEKGVVRPRLMTCCGTWGLTETAIMQNIVKEGMRSTNMNLRVLNHNLLLTKNYTFIGSIVWIWSKTVVRLWAFLKEKWHGDEEAGSADRGGAGSTATEGSKKV